MKLDFSVAVLAAGQGTRLKLDLPKVLAPISGCRLINFPLWAVDEFLADNALSGLIGVVIGHRREEVRNYVDSFSQEMANTVKFAVQEVQNGTGAALKSFYQAIPEASQSLYTLVICGDTPLIRANDLNAMFSLFKEEPNLQGVAATFITGAPKGYGRIVRGAGGFHIVEEKDATEEIRSIQEVNSGLYIFKTDFVKEHLGEINTNNKSGEFYLTDLFRDNYQVRPLVFQTEETFLGVNDLAQLEMAEAIVNSRKISELRQSGVRFLDSRTCHVEWSVKIGAGTTIYPNVYLKGNTTIGESCEIGFGAILDSCFLDKGVKVKPYSVLEDSVVHHKAEVGPFARLRPGSDIGESSKIGNFVEIKKSHLAKGVKVSHLSYVGDAEVGEESNIGCGFITCNYDGANKHKTKIGSGVFVGSDCQMIAPITLGNNVYVAAGSTINKDIPDGGFAIARERQVIKEGQAHRFIKIKEKKS